jgi:solute carrier family 13 (sodium-dependent dicarboxylate transporter), member 2/3/5
MAAAGRGQRRNGMLLGPGLSFSSTSRRSVYGLVAGLLVAVVILLLPLPDGMTEAGRRAAAVTALMAVLWISEALPIAATALLPVFAFPLLGVASTKETCAPYADPTNFFFLGGLMIAAAVERWGLHRRLALHVMSRLGGSPRQLVLGFMTATAMISMWTSNAATTMMMMPIAIACIDHFEARAVDTRGTFAPALMISVAYAASIGGVGTLVGTPPNVIFAGAFTRLFPDAPAVGFGAWMLVGAPIAIIMTPLTWLYLTRVAFRVPASAPGSDGAVLRNELVTLGPITTPERRVLIVFAVTALLWVFRADLDIGIATLPGWTRVLPDPRAIDDTVIALAMAVLLFVLPSGEAGIRLLGDDWPKRIPWGVLVLLGSGFTLAAAVESTGLAAWLASRLGGLGRMPTPVLIVAITALLVLLTEFTVNSAITALMMPVLAATAVALAIDPRLLMIPATLAASFGFMMPGGTAPNAMVFASGHITVAQMARAGIGVDLLGIVVIAVVFYLIGIPVFGIPIGSAPAWLR